MATIKHVLMIGAAVSVVGEPCADLDRLLGLNAGSYPKGPYCHALFWQVSRGAGPICFHSTASERTCPNEHPVTAEEAREEFARLSTLWDSRSEAQMRPAHTRARAESGEWVRPSGPVDLEPFVKEASPNVDLLIFGDIGYANDMLTSVARTARRKLGSVVDAAILLGDNFYPVGIRTDVRDPQFTDVFENIVTRELPHIDFHAILGNHDWMGNADAQLEYSSIHPQWIMPYYHYRRRFISADGTNTCVWFLNTEHAVPKRGRFDPGQLEWLAATLQDPSCDWKVVVGHHPIYDAGEYRDTKWFIDVIRPMLEKNGVSVYISGHEHQSQVLHNPNISSVHYLISGCTAERRSGQKQPSHPMLVWQDTATLAFVQLSVSRDQLVYRFHKGAGDPTAEPLYEGVITRSD
jgi:tartrate-resistant acid phosphatase type 5